MAIKGLSLNRKNVRQSLDLEELTGFDFSTRPDLAIFVGQAVIDRILDRTMNDNKDVYGKSFASYSSSYKKSDTFVAFGKSSKVDMELTGGMLSSIDFDVNGSVLDIFFDDDEEADKAYGHITGMEGHKTLSGKTPKREFFGISGDEFMEKIFPLIESDLDGGQALELEATTFGDFLGTQSDADFNDFFSDFIGGNNEGV